MCSRAPRTPFRYADSSDPGTAGPEKETKEMDGQINIFNARARELEQTIAANVAGIGEG